MIAASSFNVRTINKHSTLVADESCRRSCFSFGLRGGTQYGIAEYMLASSTKQLPATRRTAACERQKAYLCYEDMSPMPSRSRRGVIDVAQSMSLFRRHVTDVHRFRRSFADVVQSMSLFRRHLADVVQVLMRCSWWRTSVPVPRVEDLDRLILFFKYSIQPICLRSICSSCVEKQTDQQTYSQMCPLLLHKMLEL